MTAWGSVELTVEAMRSGARDFVQKPWDNARLLSILRTQIELGRALRRGDRLERENELLQQDASPNAHRGVRRDEARARAHRARRPVRRERPHHRRERHRQRGRRATPCTPSRDVAAAKPMVTVNVGGLSEGVFESELFGHVKGRLHGRQVRSGGTFRARGRRYAVPRRDRERAPQPAEEAPCACSRPGEFERVGSSKTKQRRRPHPLGDER